LFLLLLLLLNDRLLAAWSGRRSCVRSNDLVTSSRGVHDAPDHDELLRGV
jgi:hypothetical protein